MSDQPASKMIRVSTPLIPAVQKLCELHREGHTRFIVHALEQTIAAIESGSDIDIKLWDIDTIARLLARLESISLVALGSANRLSLQPNESLLLSNESLLEPL